MKNIRKSVFETNSSSSHSLTIYRGEGLYKKIPINMQDFDINKETCLIYNKSIVGELDKCRYLLSLIGLRMYNCVYQNEFLTSDILKYYGDKLPKIIEANKAEILKFNWLVWLEEIIKERCNTTFIYSYVDDDFPFILDCQIYEDLDLLDVLGISEEDCNNEEVIKALFTDIIFGNVILADTSEDW